MVLDGARARLRLMALEPCRCFVIPMSEIERLLEHTPCSRAT